VTALKCEDHKLEDLKRFIRDKGKHGAAVAFSGGVDSSTLAAVAKQVLGDKTIAMTAHSPTYTAEELEIAKATTREIGIRHIIVETSELENPKFCGNPENRCYFCKTELLQQLKKRANELGFSVVFEGTNFSDLADHRPGYEAVKEQPNVYSPWVEAQFTKADIRSLAKKLGLSAHDRLPQPCLATRIPYHQKITREKLQRIAAAEKTIRGLTGAKVLRVRDHEGLARIEVAREERSLFFRVECLDEIAAALQKLGFKYVAFDLEGYKSGNMLKALETPDRNPTAH
jgi:pyridinium-3,5-biscarboxylic acid mononucleotide sulfurtransferase